jgi:glycosyltransferase involved in cell wall biosynthesis
VTPYAPDRDGGGGHIRQAHLLLALARTIDVVLLTSGTVNDAAVRDAVTELVEVPAPGKPAASRARRRVDDVWGGLVGPASREVRALGEVRSGLGRALRRVRADVVLIEYAGLAPLVDHPEDHPSLASAQWLLTLHNLPSRMALQQASIMPKRRQRWVFERDVGRARHLETSALVRYDRVITVSDADAASLGGGPNVDVVPNGVDTQRFVPSPLPDAPRLLFSGALYTSPNSDAATWFCRSVLPLIRVACPQASVDIVGARPPAGIRALDGLPGVRVHPDVVSIVPFLVSARVAIVPIRIGSGTRLKALEAWAAGRPVVGTTIGLEGLGAEHGVNAMVADAAADFAAAVIRLLTEDRLAAQLATEGRALAETRYDWAVSGRRLEGIVASVAARAG